MGNTNFDITENIEVIEITDASQESIVINDSDDIVNIEIIDKTDEINFEFSEVIVVGSGEGSVEQDLQKQLDVIDDFNILVGLADKAATLSDPLWKIFKIERTVGEVPNCLFANSEATFDKIWNDRNTYTY